MSSNFEPVTHEPFIPNSSLPISGDTRLHQMGLRSFLHRISRVKPIVLWMHSRLKRVCGSWDLLAIGIGGTFGIGIFELPGEVARKYAGPAVVVSILIAAFVSFIASLCFMEFAVRIPRVGSAFIYSYVIIGELVAFLTGWLLIIQYILAVAILGQELSTIIDIMSGCVISNNLSKWLPMNNPHLAAYPDFLALGLILVLHGILLAGTKTSTVLLTVFTAISVILITVLLFIGFAYADPSNWKLGVPAKNTTSLVEEEPGPGSGGFIPFGSHGIIRGAAMVFFGFVGIYNIGDMGEEAKNPYRDIPLSILTSCLVLTIFYVGASIGLTMMLPYYQLDPVAPYLALIDQLNLSPWWWYVATGALLSIAASLLSNVIVSPRIMYAVANDHLLFRFLRKVSKKTRVPYFSIMICSIFSGLTALIFNLHQLMELVSLLCLSAYTVIAICVLLLRYGVDESSRLSFSTSSDEPFKMFLIQIFNNFKLTIPSKETYQVVKIFLALYVVWCFMICIWDHFAWDLYDDHHILVIIVSVIFALVLVFLTIPIRCQPQIYTLMTFKVRWLPFIPCLSIFCNLYLMSQMSLIFWIETIILLVIGCIFYFIYGYRKSSLRM